MTHLRASYVAVGILASVCVPGYALANGPAKMPVTINVPSPSVPTIYVPVPTTITSGATDAARGGYGGPTAGFARSVVGGSISGQVAPDVGSRGPSPSTTSVSPSNQTTVAALGNDPNDPA